MPPPTSRELDHPLTGRANWRAVLRTRAALRFLVLVGLLAALTILTLTAGPDRAALVDALRPDGGAAPAVAIGVTALLTTALVPRTLLSTVGGILFGAVAGALYIIVGVTIGALVARSVGRLLGREFMARHLRGRLLLVEQAVAKRGAVAVMISRLIPFVPFSIANYLFGTTSVRLLPFLGGTLLGVLPATAAYAALGSATAAGDPTRITAATVAVLVLGIAGTTGTFLVWRRRPRKPSVGATEPDPA